MGPGQFGPEKGQRPQYCAVAVKFWMGIWMGGDSSLLLRGEASEKLNSVHRDNIRELKKESKTKDKSSVELRALYIRIDHHISLTVQGLLMNPLYR